MAGRHIHILTGCAVVFVLLTACEGLFEGIYDQPPQEEQPAAVQVDTLPATDTAAVAISGSLYIDASSWINWYYVDLQAMADSAAQGRPTEPDLTPYPIPQTLTGKSDGKTGIYTYWFDVWGRGIANNEFRSYQPTDPQPAPSSWTFAVHRNNVRTHGGAVFETSLTDMAQLNMSREALSQLHFTADQWSENAVWTVQSQMINSLIGSQGIEVNSVLSSWLPVAIPPMPPTFTLNDHIFILRLADGSYAALQLTNYQSPKGTKCCLTINYKYPL